MGLSEKHKISIFMFAPLAAYIAALYSQYENAKPVNYIGDKGAKKLGAKELSSALLSGMYPKGYVLDLEYYLIGDQGAKALGTALASGNCPQGLVLNLAGNDIGVEGAIELAAALESGKCPEGFVLNLAHSSIGDEGAKELAAALISGKCPERLELNLVGNDIDEEGKAALEKALKSGNAPYGTKIVGLGPDIDQLCRDNNQSIKEKRNALLVLSSSKITNLPTPNSLIPEDIIHEVLSNLRGHLPQREINALISSKVITKRNTSLLSTAEKFISKNGTNCCVDNTTNTGASDLSAIFTAYIPEKTNANEGQSNLTAPPPRLRAHTNPMQ